MKQSLHAVPPADDDPARYGPQLDLAAGEALLRRLELTVRTKLDGLLQGNYQGLVPGPGSDAGEARPYVVGDDVRRMDWAVTARTTTPHIRQTVVDRELETWLVVDLSPSMDFGTALSEKRELVLAAMTAVTHLTVRAGNRVGAVIGNGAQAFTVAARPGRTHARYVLRRIAATPRSQPPQPARRGSREVPSAQQADLASLLAMMRRPQRRRGLVAVVSDFLEPSAANADSAGTAGPAGSPLSWERPLRALAGRHELLAVEVLDPRELSLPDNGLVTFVDPESGRELEVQTSDRAVRQRFEAGALEQRRRIATGLRHAGAAHLQLRTDREWVSDVVRFVVTRRSSIAGAVSGGGAR